MSHFILATVSSLVQFRNTTIFLVHFFLLLWSIIIIIIINITSLFFFIIIISHIKKHRGQAVPQTCYNEYLPPKYTGRPTLNFTTVTFFLI